MSLVQRLEEIFEEAKAKAYEFEAPIATALHAIAQHVETIEPAAGAASLEQLVASHVEQAKAALEEAMGSKLGLEVKSEVGALTQDLITRQEAAVAALAATVDKRVTDLFGQLLAKAAADDAAKAPPTPPEQLAAPAAGTADPQPQAAAAAAAPVAQPA